MGINNTDYALPKLPRHLIEMFMEELLHWIVEFVKSFGYVGIFIMTFLESTFVPLPAEITMIPAGYLVQQGEMHFLPLMLISITGTVAGSWLNYWIADHYGRKLFARHKKLFMMSEQKLDKMEEYFKEHGPVSVFTGRLIPGVRHYISFPAGLARMNLRKFILYTGLGGGIWMTTLAALGFFIGQNEQLLHKYIKIIKFTVIAVVVLVVGFYVWRHKKNKKNAG